MKVFRILKSRIVKNQEEWVVKRREVCFVCPLNSKNQKKLSRKVRVYKFLSDLLDKIMFVEKVELGQCSHEDCGCPIFFKSKIDIEECPENKWKSIYIPNNK